MNKPTNKITAMYHTFFKETKWFVRNAKSRNERRWYKKKAAKAMRQQGKEEAKL